MMLPQFGQIFSMIVGVRGLPWQPLSIERKPSIAGQMPAVAFLVLLYIMIAWGAPNIIGMHPYGKRRKRLASLIPAFRQSIYHIIIIICGTPKLLVCMGDLIRHALQEFPQQLHANGGMPLQQVI